MRTAPLVLLTITALTVPATALHAGMPSPLPSEDEWARVLRLNETIDQRLQVISFFVAGLLGSAFIVRWLWNRLGRDLPLPRLSFASALGGIVLWGLLFVIVLTMISGAREIMTPGAWKKQGFTYQLADAEPRKDDLDPATLQREQLQQLRQALWHFAATHQGRFPNDAERNFIPADLWLIPETGGQRFRYLSDQQVDASAAPLVIGPDTSLGRRLVLRTDGTIAELPIAEIAPLTTAGARP